VSDLARRYDPAESSQSSPPSRPLPSTRAVSQSAEIVHSDICGCEACARKVYGRRSPQQQSTNGIADRQQRRTSMPVLPRR